jgi:hypothetical protein
MPTQVPEFLAGTALSAGTSSPGAFKSASFDDNFAKFLRFTSYSEAEIGEGFAAARAIEDGNEESWSRAWQETARRVAGVARERLDRGHRVSAREAFLRATSYYQATFFFLPYRDPRRPSAFPTRGGRCRGWALHCDDPAALRHQPTGCRRRSHRADRFQHGRLFGPRAVAFEKRIAACIADCLLPDVYTPVVARRHTPFAPVIFAGQRHDRTVAVERRTATARSRRTGRYSLRPSHLMDPPGLRGSVRPGAARPAFG